MLECIFSTILADISAAEAEGLRDLCMVNNVERRRDERWPSGIYFRL